MSDYAQEGLTHNKTPSANFAPERARTVLGKQKESYSSSSVVFFSFRIRLFSLPPITLK